MLTKPCFLLVFLALTASSASAQKFVPPPPDVSDPSQDVLQDYNAVVTSQKHLAESIEKLMAAYQALRTENEKMKKPPSAEPEKQPSP